MVHTDVKKKLTEAMKGRKELEVLVLRGLLSLCTYELTAKGRKPDETLSDEDVLGLVRRSIKQRKDAAEQFLKGGRAELAAKEDAECAYLETFLPAQMSEEEVASIVVRKKGELGITDKSGMGKLIGAVVKETAGRADGTLVKALVEKSFNELF